MQERCANGLGPILLVAEVDHYRAEVVEQLADNGEFRQVRRVDPPVLAEPAVPRWTSRETAVMRSMAWWIGRGVKADDGTGRATNWTG